MNRKQLAALWGLLFVFTLMTSFYLVRNSDVRFSSWSRAYMELTRRSWAELEQDDVYLMEYNAQVMTKRYAVLSFLVLNLGALLIYVLRSKEAGEKLKLEKTLKLGLVAAGVVWVMYFVYLLNRVSGDKLSWVLSPVNSVPFISILALIAIALLVVQWEIDSVRRSGS